MEMNHDIEYFLLEKFSKGAQSCTIHSNKLRSLNDILRGYQLDPSVEMTELREDLYYLNNLLDECQRLAGKCPFIGFDDVSSYLDVRQKLKEVKLKLIQDYGDPRGLGSHNSLSVPDPAQSALPPSSQPGSSPQASLSPQPGANQSSARADPLQVHGFEDEIIKLERLLISPCKFKSVGITGITGIGKTTLCEELLKRSEKVRKHFLIRVCVKLSETDNNIEVVKKTLDALGVEKKIVEKVLEDHGLDGLVCALYVRLMGKRYLIVLDDVRSQNDWYKALDAAFPAESECQWGKFLAYGFQKGYGGTVIVTTRDEEVAQKMVKEEENILRLLPLANGEDAWRIFADALQLDKETFEPSEDVKKEILKKCAGVPLAARMMGKIMKELIVSNKLGQEAFQALQFTDRA